MTQPIPFILSLKAQADRFADLLTVTTWALGLVQGAWMVLHWFGQLDTTPPRALSLLSLDVAIFWLVFNAIAALIDYMIFACLAAVAEFSSAFLTAFTVSSPADHASDVTPRLDPAVAYLRDFQQRIRKASDPVQPPPPTAA